MFKTSPSDATSIINVSIILPIFNGEKWIDACLNSIVTQSALKKDLTLEISIFNDSSTDNTEKLLTSWKTKIENSKILFTLTRNSSGNPKGVGYAKNAAIKASRGEYLCFQDVDDVMLADRIFKQYLAAKSNINDIIGCKFTRDPINSTERFTKWANNLTHTELTLQVYTSHGPTVIMPTWFFHRDIYKRVGDFSEENKGTPEDLIFFYEHLNKGGSVHRVDEYLLIYTYHLGSATFSVSSDIIWDIRIQHFIKNFLPLCAAGFTVWNGGKQGRKFLKSLNDDQRKLVKALCDIDPNKIGKFYEMFCPTKRKVLNKIPIVHFRDASPPLVVCIKLDLTDGDFEKNLSSLNLKEGKDYIIFS